MGAPNKVKVVLIGAGNWGLEHARIFAARPDVDFCAIMGRTETKTRARAEQFGTRYYLDIQEMLDKERPDLVSMSLPNQEHFEPTLQVIQAGYPLLVEKPLVFSLNEADTLLAEAEKRNLFFAINFNWRYARPSQYSAEAIRAGRLGEIVFAAWRFGGEGSSDHAHANLIETQCHAFDLLEFLCGPIDSIAAQMTNKTGGGYRTLVLALHFANDAIGSLVGSYDSSYAYPDTHRLEVNGTKGRIVIEDTVKRYSFQPTGSEVGEVWQAGFFNDKDREFHRTFDRHMDAVLEAFKRQQQPPIHAQAGRRALKLAMAAIESFESGKRILV
jgi:myo-inositol 2-dehydrogenase / D-chiro-inositol 1-dehydrogenase